MSFIKRISNATLRIHTANVTAAPVSVRSIRIKASSQVKPNGEHHSGPADSHTVDKTCRQGALDPQAQNAQDSMASKREDRPAYVHGRLYKDGGSGTGGASAGGSEDANAAGWWDHMKQKMRMSASESEAKQGSERENGPI